MNDNNNYLMEIKGITKYFPLTSGILSRVSGYLKAVDGVDLYLEKGETLGIVGESGCGKTTLGKVVLRLLDPTDGQIIFQGQDISALSERECCPLRRNMQFVFQDPYASLHPRMTAGAIIGEPLSLNGVARGKEKMEKVKQLMEAVGLDPNLSHKYPHEFSGGQRQRIGVARALALNPELIVCDEPVSALDVSIQSQIINLLEDLQEEYGLTYLFISHDLSVVRHICDRVGVMYLGQVIELAEVDNLFAGPKHPYTEALLSAIPIPDPERKVERVILKGDVPTPINIPPGCRFHTRCNYKMEICSKEQPEFRDVGGGHMVACHLY